MHENGSPFVHFGVSAVHIANDFIFCWPCIM